MSSRGVDTSFSIRNRNEYLNEIKKKFQKIIRQENITIIDENEPQLEHAFISKSLLIDLKFPCGSNN